MKRNFSRHGITGRYAEEQTLGDQRRLRPYLSLLVTFACRLCTSPTLPSLSAKCRLKKTPWHICHLIDLPLRTNKPKKFKIDSQMRQPYLHYLCTITVSLYSKFICINYINCITYIACNCTAERGDVLGNRSLDEIRRELLREAFKYYLAGFFPLRGDVSPNSATLSWVK